MGLAGFFFPLFQPMLGMGGQVLPFSVQSSATCTSRIPLAGKSGTPVRSDSMTMVFS
jgi:hypothetical protein